MTTAGSRLINSAKQAAAIARGEVAPQKIHVPAEIDVKAIRHKLRVSQDDFASEFGFSLNQIRDWEQNRTRPLGGNRAYLLLIDSNPEKVKAMLRKMRSLIAEESDDADDRMECAM